MAIPWPKICRFIMVGGGVTGLNYVLCLAMISAGLHYLVATIVGWTVCVTVGFLGNRYWTFMRRSSPNVREVSRYIASYVLQLLVGSATLALLVEIMRIDFHFAFFINVAITALLSFFFLDRLVFPEPRRLTPFVRPAAAQQDAS